MRDLVNELIMVNAKQIVQQVADDPMPNGEDEVTRAAFIGFGEGFQTALELAMLSPDLARRVIESIHQWHIERNAQTEREFNAHARVFIEKASQL